MTTAPPRPEPEQDAAALEGDLAQFYPTEILQFLQLAEATGRLEFVRPGERAELLLDRGRPVFARTSGLAVRVGEILVHRGAISAETLERALEEQAKRPGVRLGRHLISLGLVSRDQVAHAVEETLRRILYGLMLWREGRFHFEPGEPVGGGDIELDIELDRLILEGLSELDQERSAGAS